MAAKNELVAKRLVERLNIKNCLDDLFMMKKLRPSQMEHASAQYRGFMYLVWEKRFSDSKNSVVPTDLAKIVWLEHMDDELSYDNFCQELFGEYLQFRESSKKDESMEYQQAISFI